MKENFIRKEVKLKCQKCQGTGDVKTTTQVVAKLGEIDIFNECPNCNGLGHKIQVIALQKKAIIVPIKKTRETL